MVPHNVEAERMMLNIRRRHYLQALGLFFSRIFWSEIYQIVFVYRNFPGISKIKSIFKYWARALAYREYFQSKVSPEGELLVYTYFMLECTLGALLMRKTRKTKVITRLHGFDVYFERGEYSYLPFRNYFLRNLDSMFFISENGRDYFLDKLKIRNSQFEKKLRVSRLGFHSEYHESLSGNRKAPFRMVSTSWILENKRLILIAEALKLLPHDIQLEWVHFGGYYGIDKDYYDLFLKIVADMEKQFPRIHIRVMGSTPKEDILQFYAQSDVHLFINVSVSEGIPVSMMEAGRYGIPLLGTLVGGVGEIIEHSHNGFRLPSNPSPEDIAVRILEVIRMSDEDFFQLRSNSLSRWKERFDSSRNYRDFLNDLISLWALPQSGKN